MNLNFDTLVSARFERNNDFQLEAKQFRLFFGRIDGRYPMQHGYRRAMLWLGNHMISWGSNLKNKYELRSGIMGVTVQHNHG